MSTQSPSPSPSLKGGGSEGNTRAHIAITLFAVIALLASFASITRAEDRRNRDDRDRNDRYWALWRDGSTRIDSQVRDFHEERKQPSLDGKKLFDDNNPIRLLRDTTINVNLRGPHVEFANGDVLPGRVVGAGGVDPSRGLPEHLIVSILSPLAGHDLRDSEIAVSPKFVARVVLEGEGGGDVEPGTLIFRDGRKMRVTKLRWLLGGVRALTANDSIQANFVELAEIHPPDVDPLAALAADLTAAAPEVKGADNLIGRIVTSDGAVFTYRRAMLGIDSQRSKIYPLYHIVQPAWAHESIRVPFDEIVYRSYREPDEMPLPLLPSQTLAQRTMTGFNWPWRLNRSVRDGELASGDMVADLGVGAHAYSSIAFDLPPAARKFSAWVGLDNAVGRGGCVTCAVYRDNLSGDPIWQSGFIRGGDKPVRIGPIDVKGAKRLVLVTDFGHEDRPADADPLDIRDEAAWLFPTVHVDRNALPASPPTLHEAFPQLAGWSMDEANRERVKFELHWSEHDGRWQYAMTPRNEGQYRDEDVLFELTRRMTVTAANAFFELEVAKAEEGHPGHKLSLHVDGEAYGTIMNGDVRTHGGPKSVSSRMWTFGPFARKEITLTMRVHPREDGNGRLPGIVFVNAEPHPIITDLPPSGLPLKPDVPITSLKPARVAIEAKKEQSKLEAGKQGDGKPLHVREFAFADGYGMPPGRSELVYEVDPSWDRFVAVVGLADGSSHAGPFQVYADKELIWTSGDGEDNGGYGRQTPGTQIDLAIPRGIKTITLRVDGKNRCFAAWGNAGFMKVPE